MSELQQLLDEQAIVKLAVRYCRALDTLDWPLLETVFLPDSTAELGETGPLDGIREITAACKAALERLDRSQHLVSNHEVEIDGDAATHRCYLQAQHIRKAAEGGNNYTIGGRYEDRLVRTEHGWRIVHRDLIPMWADGNIAVVTGWGPD